MGSKPDFRYLDFSSFSTIEFFLQHQGNHDHFSDDYVPVSFQSCVLFES